MSLIIVDSLGKSWSVFVYVTLLEWHWCPQCVPSIPSQQWGIALEQVQQRDQDFLPLTQRQSSVDNVATTDIFLMSNFSGHCCPTYLLRIIPSRPVRKLMNLSAGKGHHCNEVPGSCKATDCTPVFASCAPLSFFLLSVGLSSDQGQPFVSDDKMFISQIGLISPKSNLRHHYFFSFTAGDMYR